MNKDKNCGLCGEKSCADFRKNIKDGKKQITDCPFHKKDNTIKLSYYTIMIFPAYFFTSYTY